MSRRSGIGTVLPEKEGWKLLDSRLKRVQHVATLAPPPAYVEALGMYTNPARATLVRRLKEINPQVELLDLRAHLAHMRMIKQPLELAAIQHAVDITIDTIKEVTRPAHWAKYAFEYEIEADITRGFRRRGAEGHAFTPIVASGERGCTLHYIRNNHALATGEAVVMDIGARAEHYAADITRTVPIGAPTRRFGQVFDAVAQAQDFAFSLLKPGVLLGDCEEQVVAFVGEKLRELGLIKSISKAAVRELFPHAAFHHLGLDTHDMGDYGHPLEPGVVLAMEPGIYIPAEGVGVRIEDNVLITPNGAQNLSSRLPRVIH
jgi:Xaa-Pro aminopeptidase